MQASEYTPQEIFTQALLHALELNDRETAAHSCRVAMLSLKIGQTLGLSEEELAALRIGGLLHDVGKIGIPDSILYKLDPLTEEEWDAIERHPAYGADLLRSAPFMQDVVPVVEFHHERWDGSGYPRELKGEEIPLLARICAVAEVLDGLLSIQVYRGQTWSGDDAIQMIQCESGKAFDPAVVAVLKSLGTSDIGG